MFILGIIVDVVDDLPWLRYGHDLAICYVVSSVGNHIGLLMKPSFLIMRVDDYVLLNEPKESKDYVDSLQIRGDKRADGPNRMIDGISCLEGQLVLAVSPQGMTGERTECSRNGFTGPKI